MSGSVIVQAILIADSAVAALVADRVYYAVAPQGAARPYVVIVQTSASDEPMLQGMAQFPEASVSVACYADTFPEIASLGDAVIAALQDARGTFRGREAELRRDLGDSHDFLPGDSTHRRIINFAVRYRYG